MTLEKRIEVYTQHGGAWPYLKQMLLQEGASEPFADAFISFMCRELGTQHSERCLAIYEMWQSEDERSALAILTMS